MFKRNISHENFIKLIEYSGKRNQKYNLFTEYKSLDQYLSKLSINEILELEQTEYLPVEYDFKNYKELLKSSLKTFIAL